MYGLNKNKAIIIGALVLGLTQTASAAPSIDAVGATTTYGVTKTDSGVSTEFRNTRLNIDLTLAQLKSGKVIDAQVILKLDPSAEDKLEDLLDAKNAWVRLSNNGRFIQVIKMGKMDHDIGTMVKVPNSESHLLYSKTNKEEIVGASFELNPKTITKGFLQSLTVSAYGQDLDAWKESGDKSVLIQATKSAHGMSFMASFENAESSQTVALGVSKSYNGMTAYAQFIREMSKDEISEGAAEDQDSYQVGLEKDLGNGKSVGVNYADNGEETETTIYAKKRFKNIEIAFAATSNDGNVEYSAQAVVGVDVKTKRAINPGQKPGQNARQKQQ